jgi:uncharacterized protein YfaP (DUF2135 family)
MPILIITARARPFLPRTRWRVGTRAFNIYGGTIQIQHANLQINQGTSALSINLNNGTLIANTASSSFALDNAGSFPRNFILGSGGGSALTSWAATP